MARTGTPARASGLIVLAAISAIAQTQVTLSPTTSPAAGQAGITSLSVTGSGFPAGTILPATTDVRLEPSARGAAVTTKASAVATVVGSTRRVTFLIPASITVTAPTAYSVSISGSTSEGTAFVSSNKSALTIDPVARILSVNPSTGQRGQAIPVQIAGALTTFVQGSTQASFGAGVSVGEGAEGAFGAVTVNSRTAATAHVRIGASALPGPRDVVVRTGVQEVILPRGFVVAGGAGTISQITIHPNSIPLAVPTAVNVTATVTGTPDADSVMLQRLDAEGRVIAIVGTLHDDGLNGDVKATDGIFTVVSTFNEFAVGPVSLRVAGRFNGSTIFSPVGTLTVTGTPPPSVTITAPAHLSYLNISPTTVSGTVTGSTGPVVINSIPAPVVNGKFTAAIPLAEGPNIVTATATSASGAVGSASITVTLDTTPPHVTITSPVNQFVTTGSSISVAGNVNDIVVGTVNEQQAKVTVNGVQAQVANRTFLATNVPLTMGSNTIRAVAVDRAGLSVETQITVTRQAPQPGQIQLISGNNQTGTIGTALTAPLVVSLTEASGAPAVNKQVIFLVSQNNGMISGGGGTSTPNVVATTNAQGQASVTWKLGMRSGAGSDTAQAYSVGYSGTAVFTATANQGTPGMIVVDSGNNQTAVVNQSLPKPLIAVVVDAGHNRLANVPVTFTVKGGGGSFGGQPAITINTDPDGRAVATPTLGFQEGTVNHLFTADFPSNRGFPANFTASGRGPGDPAKTQITGLVLDNSNQPIPGVTVRAALTNVVNSNLSAVQAADTVQTDAKGAFAIYKAPVGFVKLLVDGSTATVPGAFPTLDYDMVTVPGQINTVGQPIYLLPIKSDNKLCVKGTTGGGTLTIKEAPGFSLTFGPGQVTFPGGSKDGCVSVTVVHPDKVPMVPGFGQQPRFIVTIQPSGALFNPPAPITLPNVDGLTAREVTEMYSFDHDIGSFVAIGTGTVSDDGQMIRSNAGVGVLKAGWHCGGNPSVSGAVAECGSCAYCDGVRCQPIPELLNQVCSNPCLVENAGACNKEGRCDGAKRPAGTPCPGGQCDQAGTCISGRCSDSCTALGECSYIDYQTSRCLPEVPFEEECDMCYAEAVDMIFKMSAASNAYSDFQRALGDAKSETIKFTAQLVVTALASVAVLKLSAAQAALVVGAIGALNLLIAIVDDPDQDPKGVAATAFSLLTQIVATLKDVVSVGVLSVIEVGADTLSFLVSQLDANSDVALKRGNFNKAQAEYEQARTKYLECLALNAALDPKCKPGQ